MWIITIALFLSPDIPLLAAQLGDPHFKTREAAHKILISRMSYPVALRLERIKPVNMEAAARIERLVRSYWSSQYPAPEDLPYIDALSEPNCRGCSNALTRYYYKEGCRIVITAPVRYPSFRAGTAALVADLSRWRVPPGMVKPILAAMQVRSDEWEAGLTNSPRRR